MPRRIYGFAARKNNYVHEHLVKYGVEVYVDAMEFLRRARAAGARLAIVTASANCPAVLAAGKLTELFDAQVDGMEIDRMGMRGKPWPDTFIEAARRLGTEPRRTIVLEDAIAGVEAARAGGFGLVIGVDRVGDGGELCKHGADIAVQSLGEIELSRIQPKAAMPMIGWELVYDDYDPRLEGVRETLTTLGNGYFATRGATLEAVADGISYPGTYVAGCYNRLATEIEGRWYEHEDLVNLPNWLHISFRHCGEDWQRIGSIEILSYRRVLDLRAGVLSRDLRVRDDAGRITNLSSRRIVHMAEPHLGAYELRLTPENWSGRIEVHSTLDGWVTNSGVDRYRFLANKHLVPVEASAVGDDSILLAMRTVQSGILIAEAARTQVFDAASPCVRVTRAHEGFVADELAFDVEAGRSVRIEKVVAIYTSRDHAISECRTAATAKLAEAPGFEQLRESHVLAWEQLWRSFDIELELDSREPIGAIESRVILRLHVFHLLQTACRNTIDLDVGIGARGLHGEGYRGHVFWDELFVFPFLNLRMPDMTRGLLMYRYRRLDAARQARARPAIAVRCIHGRAAAAGARRRRRSVSIRGRVAGSTTTRACNGTSVPRSSITSGSTIRSPAI